MCSSYPLNLPSFLSKGILHLVSMETATKAGRQKGTGRCAEMAEKPLCAHRSSQCKRPGAGTEGTLTQFPPHAKDKERLGEIAHHETLKFTLKP